MISKELAKAINEQMVFEMYSSYIYLGLAAGLERLKLPGAAHWMRMQVDEELIHANIFYNYLNDQEAEITLGAIDKVATKVKSAKEAFELALKHCDGTDQSALRSRGEKQQLRHDDVPEFLRDRAGAGREERSADY